MNSFWANKKVLVTGHTGFKGTWLCFWLSQLGAKVYGYALTPNSTPNLFTLIKLEELLCRSYIEDIRDQARLADAIDEIKPEIVFHLAAQSLVLPSYSAPQETYSSNVMGTVILLESLRHSPRLRAIVNVTSDKIYLNTGNAKAYNEQDPLGGTDPYSSSKSCGDIIGTAYWHSYFARQEPVVGLATARAGNVIGGGDWCENRIIPDCVRAIERQKTLVLRNPKAVRPWQHVLDCLSGYLRLAQRIYENPINFSTAFNFGPNEQNSLTVWQLVQEFRRCLGVHFDIELRDENKTFEAPMLQLNPAKAKKLLDWSARWSVPQSIEATANWVKEYLGGSSMREVCEQQILEWGK